MLPCDKILLTIVRNPFDPINSRDVSWLEWRAGMSVATLLPEPSPDLQIVASLNGNVLDDYSVLIRPGDSVAYCAKVGGLSDWLKVALMIAVVVAAPYATAALGVTAAAGYSTLTVSLVTAGIAIGGAFAINAIFPSQTPDLDLGDTDPFSDSSTYSWDARNNSDRQGVTLPVVYGTHRVTPPIIANGVTPLRLSGAYGDWIQKPEPYLDVLYAVAEGPIDSISDVRINSNSALLYGAELSTDTRTGTNVQTVIPAFNDTVNTFASGGEIKDSPVATTTYDNVTRLDIGVLWPSGWLYYNKEGARKYYIWTIKAEYRLVGATPWLEIGTYTSEPYIYMDPMRIGFSKVVDAGRYEVRVRFTVPPPELDTDPGRGVVRSIVDSCILEFANEVITDDFTYPNTALLSIKALATSRLSGSMPRVDCLVTRSRVSGVSIGSLTPGQQTESLILDFSTPEFSQTAGTIYPSARNPAWICYDILTNARYGGAVAASRIDYTAFSAWADWCDAQGLHADFYFDQSMTLSAALNNASTIGRGIVVQRGSSFTCIVDRSSTPVQMFSVANMIPNSFRETFLGSEDRANVIEVSYFDESQNYSRQVLELQASGYDLVETEVKKSSMTLYGCTSREIAARHAKFLLNCNQYLIRTVEFEADIDAIACTVGDVVYVQHDVPQWGYGGRVVSAAASAVTLDQEVVLQPATTYAVMVRHQDTDTLETRTVSAVLVEATTDTLNLTAPWTNIPEADALFAFGESGSESKLFRVIRITRNGDMRRKITALEYRAEVYDDAATIPDSPSVSALVPVEGIRLSEDFRTLENGSTGASYSNVTWRGAAFRWWVFKRNDASDLWQLMGSAEQSHLTFRNDLTDLTFQICVSPTQSPDEGVVYDATISGKPAKPVHVATPTATLTTDGILVKWVQLESETLLAGYRIYAGGVLVGATGKTNQYLYKQLTSATYSITVVPVDAWGQEPTGSASTVSATIGRPLNTRQVWIDGANIVWSFAYGLGDLAAYKLPVANGRIYFDVAGGDDYWDATNSPYLLPINPDWTDEYFFLNTIDIGGNVSSTRGAYSFTLVPPNPDSLTAVADGKTVRLSWLSTTRDPASGVIGYHSEVRRGGTDWDSATVLGTVPEAVLPVPANFTVIEATTGTKLYRVKMVDDVGHWSAEETASITL